MNTFIFKLISHDSDNDHNKKNIFIKIFRIALGRAISHLVIYSFSYLKYHVIFTRIHKHDSTVLPLEL